MRRELSRYPFPILPRRVLRLPSRLTLDRLPQILGGLVGDDLTPRVQSVEIGFNGLKKVHTEGVVFLFNVVSWLQEQGVDCTIRPPTPPLSWGNDYLDQIGFFELVGEGRLDAKNAPKRSTLPLTFVRNEEGEEWSRLKLPRWLGYRLHVDPEEVEMLRIGVGEVLNNVRDHSGQPGSCVVAQHFRQLGRVRIAISDIGVGIPSNVREKVAGLTDEDALQEAIKPGFSTQSIPGNRGAGLHTLLNQAVVQKGGEVSILSGNGRLDAYADTSGLVTETSPLGGMYPGTLLLLDLPTDTLPEPVEEDDLLWS